METKYLDCKIIVILPNILSFRIGFLVGNIFDFIVVILAQINSLL